MKKNHFSAAMKMQNDRSDTGTARKLTLHRETLRHLMADELRLAAGGVEEGGPSCGGRTC